jgi:dihydrofolate reductase
MSRCDPLPADGAPVIEIVFVVAIAENGVIGRDNALPWRLKSDLRRFRMLTIGRPVLMGRKTYESIGKPLKDRTNVVVSRQAGYGAPGIVAASSVEAALDAARGDALRRSVSEIAVVGGHDMFLRLMPFADRIELTRVHAVPDGNVLFPPINPTEWTEQVGECLPADADNSAPTTFLTLRRHQ